MDTLAQILVLLGLAVGVIVLFHRLHVPSSLGYLLVGVLVGPYTVGPVVNRSVIVQIAEFGIVFLLFTIGLSYSLPELRALRGKVLWLGTGQVLLTTAVVGVIAVMVGITPAAAFVVGAVFAQSSSTILARQLVDQGEDNSRAGRLGLAMSVFQDVTAVPFIVVIPILGASAAFSVVAGELAWAMAKVVIAIVVVVGVGHWLLARVFRMVAKSRSAELFTLTALLVVLLAAWATNALGLSLAFGAFLAGMTLGDTEFRHQVENTIRPFRDVLLGLFFVSVGMLFDPGVFVDQWLWALLGTVVLLLSKLLIVFGLVRATGTDSRSSWRTGLMVATGGEFGLALLAIALNNSVVDDQLGQVVLISVLLSMVVGSLLIRFNRQIARLLTRRSPEDSADEAAMTLPAADSLHNHVIITGYGRIGQSVGHLLEQESIPYVAVDMDPTLVAEAHRVGEPVYYAQATDAETVANLGVDNARLVVIAHDDFSAAMELLRALNRTHPELPVMVRAHDETHMAELEAAGATEVVPETLEAGLTLGSEALLLLDVPPDQVMRRIQQQRTARYRLMRDFLSGDSLISDTGEAGERLKSCKVPASSPCVGLRLGDVLPDDVTLTAVVRNGQKLPVPTRRLKVAAGDTVVVLGPKDSLRKLEAVLGDGT
jgi:monovalent cation:H+ antiporter-2, CPA2 family